MKRKIILTLVIAFLVLDSAYLLARGTYQEPSEFLDEVFNGNVPRVEKLWIQKEMKQRIQTILGHDLNMLRISYWRKAERTAWILDEIGKTLPITVGIVIHSGKIEKVKVLIFRESRGWEVRYPFFTDQYIDAGMSNDNNLDKGIDGISGATLSVNAINRLAILALYLHELVIQ